MQGMAFPHLHGTLRTGQGKAQHTYGTLPLCVQAAAVDDAKLKAPASPPPARKPVGECQARLGINQWWQALCPVVGLCLQGIGAKDRDVERGATWVAIALDNSQLAHANSAHLASTLCLCLHFCLKHPCCFSRCTFPLLCPSDQCKSIHSELKTVQKHTRTSLTQCFSIDKFFCFIAMLCPPVCSSSQVTRATSAAGSGQHWHHQHAAHG